MSFAAQEQALFDLIFSASLRAQFASSPAEALQPYDLDADEISDFMDLRPDALALDAEMRTGMVLSQMCSAFPVTSSIMAALGELTLLAELIDPTLMRAAPQERAVMFGERLKTSLAHDAAALPHGHEMVAILHAELGMAQTGAALCSTALASPPTAGGPPAIADDWNSHPVAIAEYVSASMVPGSYARLKASLCPVADRELYRHLRSTPTDPAQVQALVSDAEPRVMVARAWIDRASTCDPTARHETLELGEGFAMMLQHVDGVNSVETLLGHLAAAGAEPHMVASVRAGFRQLLTAGMLRLA